MISLSVLLVLLFALTSLPSGAETPRAPRPDLLPRRRRADAFAPTND